MDKRFMEQLKKIIDDDPDKIEAVLDYMAQICEEKRLRSVHQLEESVKWSERQTLLASASRYLKLYNRDKVL